MSKKLTYEYVKEQIEKTGYKLLSGEYKNNHTKLQMQCPLGHVFKMKWNNFQNGQRCPYCMGNAKLKYENIKKKVKKEGYNLLSKYEKFDE